MAGFGLPMPGDFNARSQQAMAGAQGAAGQMVNLHNIDSRNAQVAESMAFDRERMALDEAYRRDALAQGLHISNRELDARQPTTGDRLLAGGAGAFTGFMAGSAMSSNPYAGWVGAGIGAVSAFL